ncbi:winged helix-turn-helix transcriptional regulator [Brevundimonas sp. GCM10030266]|uniref:winged helix-turn-helix transcriptional regulator n=1 Tax=Brevundimonas sp. GCM10030266 TaxID=3273386 RepID=UPI003608D13F
MATQGAPKTRLVPKSSLNRALNALGDRWSLLIVQEAFLGATRFEEFHERLGGARSTLSSRLQALERHGILEKRPHKDEGARMAYHLTPRGLDLFDSMILMWGWGVRWGVAGRRAPTVFVHTVCGKPMLPEVRCSSCGEPMTLHSCSFVPGPGQGMEKLPVQRMHRKRQPTDGTAAFELVDLLGDRWTGLVVSVQYFGIHRFDEMQNMLGIASNILTDRLRTLENAGIFERRLYEITPPRYEYWMTKKGLDLYPHALTMLGWAETWLKDKAGPPVRIRHNCGAPLANEVACSCCKGRLRMSEVLLKPGKGHSIT